MDTLTSLWDAFIDMILANLPLSPFRQYLDYIKVWEYWPYLNWFFPFKMCLIALQAWATAITLYYTYSVVCRWLRVIS